MRTQNEVNKWFKINHIKNAQNLLDIEKILNNESFELPDNVIIDKSGIGGIDFIKWFENKKELPESYTAACEIINSFQYSNLCYNVVDPDYYYPFDVLLLDKLESFRRLIICLNAYYKCIDDYKPDWKNNESFKNCIVYDYNNEKFIICQFRSQSHILAFPTEQLANKFLKTFGRLILECKEFL